MELKLEFFEKHLGGVFEARLEASEEPMLLKLDEVEALPKRETKKENIRKEPFSLIFVGHPKFARRIIRLNLPGEAASLDLYLEPLGIDGENLEYEAVVG